MHFCSFLNSSIPVLSGSSCWRRSAFRFAFTFSVGSQSVTSMWVSWLRVAPFCPTNAVGMSRFCWQRLPLAASAEYLPSGSVSSKVSNGTSGVEANVEDVMPALLMNVSPTSLIVTP